MLLAPSFCGDNCFRVIRDLSDCISFPKVRNDSHFWIKRLKYYTDWVSTQWISNEQNQFSDFNGEGGAWTPSQHHSIFTIEPSTSISPSAHARNMKIDFVHLIFNVPRLSLCKRCGISRLNSGIFKIFELREWNLNRNSSDCRASKIILNNT